MLSNRNLIAWGVQIFRDEGNRKEVKVTTRKDDAGNMAVEMEVMKDSVSDDTDIP